MQELQLLVITGGDTDMAIIIIISYQSYCVYNRTSAILEWTRMSFMFLFLIKATTGFI